MAGDGAVAVEIADDVMVAPVIGSPGLVFVDSGGHPRGQPSHCGDLDRPR